jgi:hypothetical protein
MTKTETENTGGGTSGKQWLVMAGLVVYVLLLLVGTIGELFDVGWILNLPIYKGP